MSSYDRVGEGIAAGILAAAKAIGEKIELKHRNKTCRKLWAMVEEEQVSVVEDAGIQTEQRTRAFVIPVQTGFDVTRTVRESIIPGDRITFHDREYFVLSNGVNKTANDHVYEVQCVQNKRLASGA